MARKLVRLSIDRVDLVDKGANQLAHIVLTKRAPVGKASGLAASLPELLGNAYVMYLRAHGAHWNVEGPLFPQLHDFFGKMADDVFDSVDHVAESMRQHKMFAPNSLPSVVKFATVPTESPVKDGSPEPLVKDLLSVNLKVMDSLKQVGRDAEAVGDLGLSNFTQDRLAAHLKADWQMNAFLDGKGKVGVGKNSPGLAAVHVDAAGDERDEYEKATLTSEARNSLPDSAFAAVWTDASGKKQRKLPYKHADGSIDRGHLTAALGRIDGADIPADVKSAARRKLESAAGNTNHKEKKVSKISELFKRVVAAVNETDVSKRAAALEAVGKEADDLDKAMHNPDDPSCKCAECMAKRAPAPTIADVDKRIAEAVEKAQTATRAELQKKLDETSAQLAIEKNMRLDGEIETILKSFKATPFNLDKAKDDNDIRKFRKMRDTDSDGFDRTIALLRAQDEIVAKSAAFGNLGSSRSGGQQPAWNQIVAKADEKVSKGTNGLTREQAIDQVMLENPDLVKRYREEQSGAAQ